MRTWLIISVAALQVLVLIYMAAEREFVVATGRTIYLRTAPVDPRDAFRGDYVRLDYEISRVPRRLLKDGLTDFKDRNKKVERDTRVYAVLKEEHGLATRLYLTDRRPDSSGLFIRGRLNEGWGNSLSVRYGLEAYFVEQKKGREIEQGRREGEIHIPLEMETAVGRNGLGVLKGYRWSPLGIGLNLETETNRVIRAATVVLKNASSNDLAIVDLPGAHSLCLEVDQRGDGMEECRWVNADTPQPAVMDEHIRILKPGQTHAIRVDMNDPAWFMIVTNGPPKRISEFRQGEMFRLVYRPPTAEECRNLQDARLIWHGELMSRAFGGGRVD